MSLIKPNIRNLVYYCLFLALAFAIPIHGKLIPPVIALIGLSWLLEFNFKEKFLRIKNSIKSRYIISFGLLYVFYIIGTFYSNQLYGMEGAFFDLEVKLSMLLFPIFFSTIDFSGFRKDFFSMVQKAFIAGCIISTIFLFINAVFRYVTDNNVTQFYYTDLSMFFHPGYLALYYSFAIAIILNRLIKKQQRKTSKKLLAVVLILYFQVFIILLSSKAGIIGLILIYILAIFFIIVRQKKFSLYTFIISASLTASFIILLLFFPYSYNRIFTARQALETEEQLPASTRDGSVARVFIWESSIEIIKENFLFGVGTGDVKQSLLKKYKEKHIELALEEHLNAHDQYLQTFIAIGFIGFLLLISSIILPAIYAIRYKNLLYFLFLSMIGFHLLVESMLERQAGVVFYAFFNVFLFYFTSDNKDQ
ncbi:MAG: O-antigen ligase family protein [Bacteroidetes bacterium]|nr:O-antigen ligase family protein [Bacteroidota bacterium]MBL7103230.1 O-antigen ligase family protein [Bacteroidales bacterium]